jgi:hypothetical protein
VFPTIGQVDQSADSGGADGVAHGRIEASITTRGKGDCRVLLKWAKFARTVCRTDSAANHSGLLASCRACSPGGFSNARSFSDSKITSCA